MTEPQHAPCDMPHHLINGECGTGRCGICGETYDLGQKISRGNFHWWPEAEYAYWAHTRDSEKHQRILDIQALSVVADLERLEFHWDEIRADSKQWKDPRMRRLTRLLD